MSNLRAAIALAYVSPVDRRDDYGSWQDSGHGDRWAYDEETRVPAPRTSGYSRGPRSGEPLPPAPDPLFDPVPPQPLLPPASVPPMPTLAPSSAPPSSSYHQQPPPYQQQQQPLHEPTGAVDASSLRRSVSQTDGLYRSRKPVFIAAYGIMAAVGDLLMLRPFFKGLLTIDALAPLLAMIAFPLLAIGMYGLATGAATAVQFQGPRVWLRTPLIYIPIALGLLVAAGTAVA